MSDEQDDDSIVRTPIHHEPITHDELEFMRGTARWWMEKPERVPASRRLVRIEPDLSALVEGRRFRQRLSRSVKVFGGWLVGLVTFLAALSEVVPWLRHGGK